MHFALIHRRRPPGGSLAPVLIILAALAVSAAVFFMMNRKHFRGGGGPNVAGQSVSQSASAPAQPQSPALPDAKAAAAVMKEPDASGRSSPAGSASAAKTPPAGLGFARPMDLGSQLAKSLAAGDFKAAGKIAAAADPAQTDFAIAVLEKIFKQMGYQVGPEDKVELLGQVEDATRLSVPLIKPGDPGRPLHLQIDLVRDEKMGWKIDKFLLPKELTGALAALPSAPGAPATTVMGPDGKPLATSVPSAPSAAPAVRPSTTAMRGKSLFVVSETTDALTFANDFVRTLLKHDFVGARTLIDGQKVQPQKLAGLCIVFEEGQYALKPNKPLIITVANPEVSWVIAQVESELLQQSTEFGLELQRPSPDAEWKVVGLNLSTILGSFAQSASKLGVPYTPLVRNPKGGESLALYFEYDKADLHPRAAKQLEIVAGLLKSNPNRKLNIAGHTDAKGADDYNFRLSQARAETVKNQLVSLGVAADQVITSGLGKTQPLSPNIKADGSDDPEGRSRNRRAEIFLDF